MPISLKPYAYRIDALHLSALQSSYKEDWLSRLLSIPQTSQLEKESRLFLYSLIVLNTYSNPLIYRPNSILINTLHHGMRFSFAFKDDSVITHPALSDSFKDTKTYNLLSIISYALLGHPKMVAGSFYYEPSITLFKGDLAYYQSKAFAFAKRELSGRYGVRNLTYLYDIEKLTPTFSILSYLPSRDFYLQSKHKDAYQRNELTSNAVEGRWLSNALDGSTLGGTPSPAYHENSLPIIWKPTNHPKFSIEEMYAYTADIERLVSIEFDLRGLDVPTLETLLNNPTIAQTEARRALVDSIGYVYNDILNNPMKVRDYFQTKRNEYKR